MSPLDWICVYVCSTIFPRLGLAAKKKKKALGKHCGWCLSVVSNQFVLTINVWKLDTPKHL